MPAIPAALAIVGAGISIYGDIKSADDQASLDQTRASIAQQQAAEIQAREVANEALRDQQAWRNSQQFGSSFAASGRAGVGIGSQLQIQQQAELQNTVSNREAQFQESMLNQQAGIDTTLASNTESAGVVNAIGAGIGGASKVAGIVAPSGSGGTQSLGPYPTTMGEVVYGSQNQAGGALGGAGMYG